MKAALEARRLAEEKAAKFAAEREALERKERVEYDAEKIAA